MMASLFEMVVYIVVNLLVVKMVFFRKGQDNTPTKEESVSWKSAVDSMAIMETRLQQLQERDLRHQERTWALEDQNRDLTQRVARLTKELLLATGSNDEQGPNFDDDHGDDDDDHLHSVPPNN